MSTPLGDSLVLVVDGQTTGATPDQGSLLELGWAVVRADPDSPDGDVTASLVSLPPGHRIPPAVRRLTGLADDDLEDSIPPSLAWRGLVEAAARVRNGDGRAMAVIHFARFELPFLRRLHTLYGPDGAFPLDVVCTHEIARRLLPELPRRGLRALAGYFGMPVTQLRRAAEHVQATTFVWRHLAALLAERCGISTRSDLRTWLEQAVTRTASTYAYPMPRDKRLGLPDEPGVYRMLRTDGGTLYVGKATSLKRRVNSYFQKQSAVGERMLEMLTQARDLDVTVVPTALEAALLETDEIKRHDPPYNRSLRAEGRKPWFCARDFGSVSEQPDRRHPIGPFGSTFQPHAFAALCTVLADPERVHLRTTVLGRREPHAPDPSCFSAGLEQFRLAYLTGSTLSLQSTLLELGTVLTLAAHADESSNDEQPTEPSDEPDDWDPDRVVEKLERLVRDMSRAVRRARWLRRVSESSLVWSELGSTPCVRRVLVFKRGAIVHQGQLELGQPAPIPPGWERDAQARRRSFDIATLDRMRVLNTELRRLVLGSCDVELCFGPRLTMGGAELRRALRLV